MHWQEKWLIWLHTRYKAVYLPNIIIIYFFTDIWLNCAPVQGLINVKCTVMWLEYVRLLPSSKYCVKYGVDWLEHWIFHMFSVISAFEVCHCQPLKKIYTRGRIICNWLYSIGTPEVFWHLIKNWKWIGNFSFLFIVPKHFQSHDPTLFMQNNDIFLQD